MAGGENFVLEVCVDSLHGALEAQRGGLELCASLDLGGITPSYGLMKLIRDRITIPVHVLIRPRPGDFIYSNLEMEVMSADITAVRELGFQGVAIGATHPLSRDRHRHNACPLRECRQFNLAVTVHQAIEVISTSLGGVSRVLTSGGEVSAVEGVPMLRRLIEKKIGSVRIMPGAGISDVNTSFLVKELLVDELHGSVRKELRVSPLEDLLPGDIRNSVSWTVDAEKVQRIVKLCNDVLRERESVVFLEMKKLKTLEWCSRFIINLPMLQCSEVAILSSYLIR